MAIQIFASAASIGQVKKAFFVFLSIIVISVQKFAIITEQLLKISTSVRGAVLIDWGFLRNETDLLSLFIIMFGKLLNHTLKTFIRTYLVRQLHI